MGYIDSIVRLEKDVLACISFQELSQAQIDNLILSCLFQGYRIFPVILWPDHYHFAAGILSGTACQGKHLHQGCLSGQGIFAGGFHLSQNKDPFASIFFYCDRYLGINDIPSGQLVPYLFFQLGYGNTICMDFAY